jgi:hypothetical protein
VLGLAQITMEEVVYFHQLLLHRTALVEELADGTVRQMVMEPTGLTES